jgi:protocatechuate 3,4-dioxygenase beta subunit
MRLARLWGPILLLPAGVWFLSRVVIFQQSGGHASAVSSARPASAINGTVIGADKVPLSYAQLRLEDANSGQSWSVRTDVRGNFTFTRIPHSTYRLRASHPGYVSLYLGQQQPLEPVRLFTIPYRDEHEKPVIQLRQQPGSIGGEVIGRDGTPVSGERVIALRAGIDLDRTLRRASRMQGQASVYQETLNGFAETDGRGRYRITSLPPGGYNVFVHHRDRAVPSSTVAQRSTHVYSPGVVDSDAADVIHVAEGHESYSRIRIPTIRHIRVSGTVLSSRGSPVGGANVRAFRSLRDSRMVVAAAGQAGPNGEFDLSIPIECECVIYATASRPWDRVGIQKDTEMGSTPTYVSGNAVSNVVVRMQPPSTLHGRITGHDIGELAALRVAAFPMDRWDGVAAPPASAPVAADGSFTLRNVFGRTLLDVGAPPNGPWAVQVLESEKDVTYSGLDPTKGSSSSALRLKVLPHGRSLTGTVRGAQDVSYVSVILLSANPERRQDSLHRYVRVARTDAAGQFEFYDLRPGSYRAVAVRTVQLTDLENLSTLAVLERMATPVVIQGGREGRFDLPLVTASVQSEQ